MRRIEVRMLSFIQFAIVTGEQAKPA